MEGSSVEPAGNAQRVDAKSPQRDGGGIEVVDPFAEEVIVSAAEKSGLTREQAIAFGRQLAEDECAKLAQRRAEFTDADCRERVKRAEAYAAWEYDGRAMGTIGRRVP